MALDRISKLNETQGYKSAITLDEKVILFAETQPTKVKGIAKSLAHIILMKASASLSFVLCAFMPTDQPPSVCFPPGIGAYPTLPNTFDHIAIYLLSWDLRIYNFPHNCLKH